MLRICARDMKNKPASVNKSLVDIKIYVIQEGKYVLCYRLSFQSIIARRTVITTAAPFTQKGTYQPFISISTLKKCEVYVMSK